MDSFPFVGYVSPGRAKHNLQKVKQTVESADRCHALAMYAIRKPSVRIA
jgi:hypothetical protein